MDLAQISKTIFGSKLNRSVDATPHETANVKPIQLKRFVNLELDISGWYAMGHHDPEDFLAAVVEQDAVYPFYVRRVKQGWAKFDGNQFEFLTYPASGFQSITVLESFI